MSDVAAEIKVGDTAPDFNLKDQDQQDVKLSDYKGKKNVVLCFYPLDWSPVCQGENKCLTDDFPKFQNANAELFGISCDSFFSHKAWAKKLSQAPPIVRRPSDDCQGLWAVFRAAQLLKARHGYRGQERQGRLCEGPGDQGGKGRQRHSFCTLETELGAPVTTEGCRLTAIAVLSIERSH